MQVRKDLQILLSNLKHQVHNLEYNIYFRQK